MIAESDPSGAGVGNSLEFHRFVEAVVAEDERDRHQHKCDGQHDSDPHAARDPGASPLRSIGAPN